MASKTRFCPSRYPLTSGLPITHPLGLADGLENASNILFCLADLFGGDTSKGGYEPLSGQAARQGAWLQLTMVAQLLREAAQLVTVSDSQIASEVIVTLDQRESSELCALAKARGMSAENLVGRLIEREITSPEKS